MLLCYDIMEILYSKLGFVVQLRFKQLNKLAYTNLDISNSLKTNGKSNTILIYPSKIGTCDITKIKNDASKSAEIKMDETDMIDLKYFGKLYCI